MLNIALTGNIAAGKSTVVQRLAEHGACIVDADLLAREAVAPGTPGLDRIVQRFGKGVLTSEGALDRATLRKRVFADRRELDALNAIVHPDVARRREALVLAARARGERILISDIPLLFETHLEGSFDRIILVDAPVEIRLERLVHDRGLTEPEARDMLAAQMPASQKRRRADIVIDNDGSRENLLARVDSVWKDLAPLASAASR
jgi:dephospho-CoA kinase